MATDSYYRFTDGQRELARAYPNEVSAKLQELSLSGQNFIIEAREEPVFRMKDMFRLVPVYSQRAKSFQCIICFKLIGFKDRATHAKEKHQRGWRTYPEDIVRDKDFPNLQDFIPVEQRRPYLYFREHYCKPKLGDWLVINRWEVECPIRVAPEWPCRHPTEAYLNNPLQLESDDSRAMLATKLCRICGREVPNKSLGFHLKNHHNKCNTPNIKFDNMTLSKRLEILRQVPTKYRMPTGYFHNPLQPIRPTQFCKLIKLQPWENSPIEEIRQLGWTEDRQEVPSEQDIVTFSESEDSPLPYNKAFTRTPELHPWFNENLSSSYEMCLICGHFVALNQRRRHMETFHAAIRMAEVLECPHPKCIEASKENDCEDTALLNTCDWKEHLQAMHNGEKDPRTIALEHIPGNQRIRWGYLNIPVVAPTEKQMNQLARGFDSPEEQSLQFNSQESLTEASKAKRIKLSILQQKSPLAPVNHCLPRSTTTVHPSKPNIFRQLSDSSSSDSDMDENSSEDIADATFIEQALLSIDD